MGSLGFRANSELVNQLLRPGGVWEVFDTQPLGKAIRTSPNPSCKDRRDRPSAPRPCHADGDCAGLPCRMRMERGCRGTGGMAAKGNGGVHCASGSEVKSAESAKAAQVQNGVNYE